MYSANLKDQLFSAAIPLKPFVNWVGSAGTVAVAIPPAPATAGVDATAVGVSLTLPSGLSLTASAVHVAGTPIWSATFAATAFATPGIVTDGLTITVAGKDETGAERTWFVARGDVEIRSAAAVPSPGDSYYLFKLRDSAPDAPVEGDAYVSGGELHLYAGGEWQTIGGSSVTVDPTLTQSGAAADAKAVGDALAQKRGLGDLAVYAPSAFSEWTYTVSPAFPAGASITVVRGETYGFSDSYWAAGVDYPDGGGPYPLGGDASSTNLTLTSHFDMEGPEYTVAFTRTVTAWTPASPADALAKTSQLPTVPSAYASTPAMDGAGSAGSSTAWARGDHVHPSDTSRAAKTDLPYPFAPVVVEQGVATITPRTVATYTAGTTAASFSIAVGAGTTGAARDCVLVVDCTAAGAVAPTVTWPSNFHPRTDAEEIAPVAGVRNVFYVSEYATGQFVVGGWHEEAE